MVFGPRSSSSGIGSGQGLARARAMSISICVNVNLCLYLSIYLHIYIYMYIHMLCIDCKVMQILHFKYLFTCIIKVCIYVVSFCRDQQEGQSRRCVSARSAPPSPPHLKSFLTSLNYRVLKGRGFMGGRYQGTLWEA